MPIPKSLYRDQAEQYEQLVAHEDYQHHLLPALARLHALEGADVVEMGAGTGRVTRLLAPHVRRMRSFDASPGMLRIARRQLYAAGLSKVVLAVADNRVLPVASGSADLCIEGWSVAQMIAWERDTWHDTARQVLDEMRRVVRPGGMLILIETLGTGSAEPRPPSEWMAELYGYFETEGGFTRTWVRTDFHFASAAEAQALVGFFWGEELARAMLAQAVPGEGNSLMVPECTGIWWAT
jgi:ubiquinone/menaquinone biosynthesis C-methylase UbiE